MQQDYNSTLNLPQTEFSMRGNLTQKEPKILEEWENAHIYHEMIKKNEGKPSYILHDGPPYANGSIHLGTALNKTLKDIIVKYKNMSGFCAPYVPGWDTHGLPIELKALKAKGVEKGGISQVELRKTCREFAMSHVENQMKQFKRLGTWGNYENPYLTLRPEFEAKQIEVFGKMVEKGYIYKGLKPVYWCPECGTALAEAEIEYADDPCKSVYVKFKVTDDKGVFTSKGISLDNTYFVIWTTTTWTLPGNLAICVGSDYDYTIVKVNGENLIMAEALVAPSMQAAGITDYTTEGQFKGAELEYMVTRHPFMGRDSLVIVGDHVTLESGTGCVHTAPGFGVDDFEVCKRYKEIGIVVSVDANGKMTEEAGEFVGLTTDEANKAIFKKMTEIGCLFGSENIKHQYPHCWRCKKPILFRATEQWFCSIDGFKEDAIKAIEAVNWIPEWGEERIKGMVRDRSDWCISRQRTWGVPIPIVYCDDCGKPLITTETIKAIADVFRENGSDAWYTMDIMDILPKGTVCGCGGTHFTRETDIMDVWFDSGVTHAGVLEVWDELSAPADLYLEGADQYRGWFQSSLLTSVVWRGTAPYKNVCTHGWVVDGEGKKMSKSLGNGIEADDIINEYGADILRLWVASSDYHSDIRVSKEILKQLSEAYKKIRNTARFILGNLDNCGGFDAENDSVSDNELLEIDKWALTRLDTLIDKVKAGYDAFDFHIAFHAIHNFCVTDMSNFYLDIIKDRLYCAPAKSVERRAAQTVMCRILSAVCRLIAPIMAFTAEEIWKYIPHCASDDVRSVVLNQMPEKSGIAVDDEFTAKWDSIYALRETVNKALEEKRNEKLIGKSLEAKVTLKCRTADFDRICSYKDILPTVFIVSKVEVVSDDSIAAEVPAEVIVEKATGEKCERCWVISEEVGTNEKHPTLCCRCAKVVEE